jgi:hypothetical protein
VLVTAWVEDEDPAWADHDEDDVESDDVEPEVELEVDEVEVLLDDDEAAAVLSAVAAIRAPRPRNTAAESAAVATRERAAACRRLTRRGVWPGVRSIGGRPMESSCQWLLDREPAR